VNCNITHCHTVTLKVKPNDRIRIDSLVERDDGQRSTDWQYAHGIPLDKLVSDLVRQGYYRLGYDDIKGTVAYRKVYRSKVDEASVLIQCRLETPHDDYAYLMELDTKLALMQLTSDEYAEAEDRARARIAIEQDSMA
jgi:hypothetical protein